MLTHTILGLVNELSTAAESFANATDGTPIPAAARRGIVDWSTWCENFIGHVQNQGVEWFWKIVAAFAILVAGHYASRFFVRLTENYLSKTSLDATLLRFFSRVVHAFMFLTVVLAVLHTFGVQTASLVAILGTIGLAIGLALQGSLSNFSAGVMLVVLRPFKMHDFVEVGAVSGVVEEIGVFSTILRTGDNRLVLVPNSLFMGQPVMNASAKPERRIDLVIGISYGDDIQKAREIILRVLGEEPRVLAEPAPVVALGELAESSVNLLVRPWVASGDYWAVRWALLERLKLALEAGGCSIPFPQRDVHVIAQANAVQPQTPAE